MNSSESYSSWLALGTGRHKIVPHCLLLRNVGQAFEVKENYRSCGFSKSELVVVAPLGGFQEWVAGVALLFGSVLHL